MEILGLGGRGSCIFNTLGTISLKLLGSKLAPKLVCFILRKVKWHPGLWVKNVYDTAEQGWQ